MSEDETRTLNDPPLLERILVKLETMDARLQLIEQKVEQRGFETNPIWERALAEIMEVNQRVMTLDRKLDVLGKDMLALRADQLGIEERLRNLEAERSGGGVQTRG